MLPFFMDEDSMHRAVVRGLRAEGIGVLTVAEAGRKGLPDEDQLVFAASEGRSIYSSNVSDFARLNAAWQRAGLHHAGLVLLTDQQTPIGVQIRALTRLAKAMDAQTMQDRLEYLSGWLEHEPL